MIRPFSSRAGACRVAAAAVGLAAALGPEATGMRRDLCRVLLVDISASCGGRAPSPEEMAALSDGLVRGDRAAVIAFAEGAETLAGLSAVADVAPRASALRRWESSLAAGLEAAAALRPAVGRLEVLVASDGLVTDDATRIDAAVATLRAPRGAVSLRVLRRDGVALPSSVEELRGPGRAALGEVVAIEARGVAGAGGATVELLGGGDVIERRRVDRPGPFRLVFTRIADAPGLASWEARTSESGEVAPAVARVVVAAAESSVLVSRGPARAAIERALGAGTRVIDVSHEAPNAREFASRIVGAGAVVLDDVSPEDVRAVTPTLVAFVRGGGGLLLLGGASSFGAGGWQVGAQDDEFAAMLPLWCEPPDESGVVIYLAIDGSGSMGEPWPTAGAAVLRDTAVRDAARTLVGAAPRGATVYVRRFREFPVPEGAGPSVVDLSGPAEELATRRADGRRAIDALPAPGGSTAFVPVLTEAADLLASRSDRTRIALFLTDGRSSEAPAAIEVAIRRLLAAGVRVAVVAPGRLDAGATDASLLAAAAAADPLGGVTVRAADEPARLADVLLATQREARDGGPILVGLSVSPTAEAGALDPFGAAPRTWPQQARKLNRTWSASDATVIARASDESPLAAVRTERGAGRVGAVAARVGDPEWLDGDGGVSMSAAMLAGVRRRGSAAVRVFADGPTLRATFDSLAIGGQSSAGSPSAVPVRAVFSAAGVEVGSSPLVGPDAAGVVTADRVEGADRVDFVGADGTVNGTVIVSAGVDRPAPPELRRPSLIDFDQLAARLHRGDGRDAPREDVPLRPWLAALAIALLVAGSVKSSSRSTR